MKTPIRTTAILLWLTFVGEALGAPPSGDVPRTWDDQGMADLVVPLADPAATPEHVPAEYYYRIPVRRIYRSYPVYHPEKEPAGYFADLLRRQPEVVWDDKDTRPTLETETDWIAAGEVVFDAALIFSANSLLGPSAASELYVRDPKWFQQTDAPTTPEGILPYVRYVIREQGKVEVGTLSCAMCHTRILPDGSVIKGAQGNFPFSKAFAYEIRDPHIIEPAYRGMLRSLYTVPWLPTDPQEPLNGLPVDLVAAHFDAIPAGVIPRHGTGWWSPVQVPDLIGVQNRRYLDRTGLQRHRGHVDLMRYAALNQGLDNLTTYGGRLLSGQTERAAPEQFFEQRYSDEQLYALTEFVYSLRPPTNPFLPATEAQVETVERGRDIFMASKNRCAVCHDPRQGYTNNKLVSATGFQIPRDHP